MGAYYTEEQREMGQQQQRGTTRRRPPRTPLEDAFYMALNIRWRGLRSEKRAASLVGAWQDWLKARAIGHLDDITTADIAEYMAERADAGDAPATITCRLVHLKAVFDEALRASPPLASRAMPDVRRPRRRRSEKWWLTPDKREELVAHLRPHDPLLADYVEFVVETGLRVEEALRLLPRHFSGLDSEKPLLFVPGTKTAGSQASLPISKLAADIASRRIMDDGGPLFPISYSSLKRRWGRARAAVGLGGVEGCTLKALRRSFAGEKYRRGIPTEVLRRLMRHEDIATTGEYLRLCGNGDLEIAREWL